MTITPTSSSSPTPAPTLDPVKQKTQYKLDVTFNYSTHQLNVTQVVDFTNSGSEAYADLEFQVEPNDHPGDISFKHISLGNGPDITDTSLEKNHLKIPLALPILPGHSGQVKLSYELSLPPVPPPTNWVRPTIFGYTANQANLVDWFPFLPPYQAGKGWLIHAPWYYGEHQVYPTADFTVNLALINPPTGLTIAAASSAREDSTGSHYRLENARTFAWSASTLYYKTSTQAGPVEVVGYAFQIDQRAGQEALRSAARAVTVYASLFGPYQHATLSVVEGDFLDGMEYDGLFFLSKGFYNLYDGTPKGYLTAISVHETAHQWWYGQVGNDQAQDPWLDEALATYSEKLFYEYTAPDLVKWWWDFRVNYYSPQGAIDQPIYAFIGFEPYRNAVYLRGAQFLDALRGQIGDDAFFAFLKDYVIQESYTIATRQDFFRLLSEHTTVDMSGLKSKYFTASSW